MIVKVVVIVMMMIELIVIMSLSFSVFKNFFALY